MLYSELTIAQPYTVSPTIPDFTDLDAPCVDATYGDTQNPYFIHGLASGRHTLITEQGTDPNTDNKLSLLPSGESKVIRLGDAKVQAQAESISYKFIVDKDSSVLMLKYAIVLQHPMHAHENQPRFIVEILDENGDLVDSCARYDVSAANDLEGFHENKEEKNGMITLWRDWTDVGLDLSQYSGKAVQVRFTTYDCALGAHFGYAYFTAKCIPNKLIMSGCDGQEVTITAPDNFFSYVWHDGSLGQTKTEKVYNNDINISCEITSVMGCKFTLNALISSKYIPVQDIIIYDTVCEGDPYIRDQYFIPPQEPGDHVFYTTFINPQQCSDDYSSTLFLYVEQRYTIYEAAICKDEGYSDEHGFFFSDTTSPGFYTDTIKTLTTSGCEHFDVLLLTISVNFEPPPAIVGDLSPCQGEEMFYESAEEIADNGEYWWEVPEGIQILYGQNSGRIKVLVTDHAVAGKVAMHGRNGCGADSSTISVSPKATHWITIADSVCTGVEYHKNNFNIPAQDSFGLVIDFQYHKNTSGCDSTVVLNLNIIQQPEVGIIVDDSIMCQSDSVTLQTFGTGATLADSIIPLPIAIGDIFYADDNKGDTSFVKPDRFDPQWQKPLGVVFWLDRGGKHGLMVSLKDIQVDFRSGSDAKNLKPLIKNISLDKAIHLMDGYNTTVRLKDLNCNNISQVDLVNGWYIPAMGELFRLTMSMYEVNVTLKMLKETPAYNTTKLIFGTGSVEVGGGDIFAEYSSCTFFNDHPDHYTITYGRYRRNYVNPFNFFASERSSVTGGLVIRTIKKF
ncbi:MAG: hypothetical protein LBM07_05935 [Culturomica sp.]|nr:hypothetical protein [Culturomica sp.]